MVWYKFISLIALIICFINLSYHFIRLIRLGPPKDFSLKRGNIKSAITYSFSGAMNPLKKESAYLHLPTYTAGILYHIGTLVSIILFFLVFFNTTIANLFQWVSVCILTVSSISGIGILIKRISAEKLRHLSNPDDYISNLLVTGFHIFTMIILIQESVSLYYYIYSSLLFLYIPLGKLKHFLYFFAARYHLGFFYGWRGIWPFKDIDQTV